MGKLNDVCEQEQIVDNSMNDRSFWQWTWKQLGERILGERQQSDKQRDKGSTFAPICLESSCELLSPAQWQSRFQNVKLQNLFCSTNKSQVGREPEEGGCAFSIVI